MGPSNPFSPCVTPEGVILADTITKLGPQARGAVVVSGSHGGAYPAYLAIRSGVRAVILNDAGVGKDRSGVASLGYCEALGVAAATVSHESCRIGDTADMLRRGVVSHVNRVARDTGANFEMSCLNAAIALTRAPHLEVEPPKQAEGRQEVKLSGASRRLILLDSASLVCPEDSGQVVVTGSHGGLIGGDPAKALKADAFAAVFNDAGAGCDEAGVTRLPALDARGIAGVVVGVSSARIGDGRSSYEDGMISRVNRRAEALGAKPGMAVRLIVDQWARESN